MREEFNKRKQKGGIMPISTTLPHEQQETIIRLYGMFERKPDTAGLAYWYTQAERGMSLLDMAAQFAANPEWVAHYGSLTAEQLVTVMYEVVLGRVPDLAGKHYWVEQVSGGLSVAELVIGFTQSPEFVVRAAAGVERTFYDVAHDIEPAGPPPPPFVPPHLVGTQADIAALELSQLVYGTTPANADAYTQNVSAFQVAFTARDGHAKSAWMDLGQAMQAANPTNTLFAGEDTAFITAVYQSVYGGTPSASILANWENTLSQFEQTIGSNARGALLGAIAYEAEVSGHSVLSGAAHTVAEVNNFINWGVSLLDQHPQVVTETVTVTDTVTITETVEVPSPHVISFGSDQLIDTSALNAGGTTSVLGTPTRMVGGFDQTDSSQFGLQVVQGGSELVPTSFSWSGTTADAGVTGTG